MDALLEGGEDDRVGDARLRVGLAEIDDDGAEVKDFVKGGLDLRTTDFHAGQKTDAAALSGERREGIGCVEASEPT